MPPSTCTVFRGVFSLLFRQAELEKRAPRSAVEYYHMLLALLQRGIACTRRAT